MTLWGSLSWGRLRPWGRCWPALLVGVCTGVQCAVTISPVIVHIPSQGRAIITVRNDRAHEVMYQLTLLRWFQQDGADHFEPTQDFMASPPHFALAAHATQVIRLGLRRPERLPVEQSYRLVLAEVPQVRDTQRGPGRVDFSMQYALPVFVAPAQPESPPTLVWQWRQEAGAVVLRADNPCTRHMVVNQVGLTDAAHPNPVVQHLSQRRVTVLAHAWREWRFPGARLEGPLPWQIWVKKDGQEAPERVPVGQLPRHAC